MYESIRPASFVPTDVLPVPASVPDTIPNALIQSLPSVQDSAGRLLRSQIVNVRSGMGTTIAQKQAAVDAAGGLVVGGSAAPSPDEGIHVLRVASATTASKLLDAYFTLENFPHVAAVYLIDTLHPPQESCLRPDDGAGLSAAGWSVTRNSAAGINWALQRIDAPLDWGCSVGDVTVSRGRRNGDTTEGLWNSRAARR